MKYPYASLTNQQARDTYFVVPDLADQHPGLNFHALALGEDGYRQFKADRKRMRDLGGELLLIGWPDGTTITYGLEDRATPIDLDTLADTYRASSTMYRICNPKVSS